LADLILEQNNRELTEAEGYCFNHIALSRCQGGDNLSFPFSSFIRLHQRVVGS